MNLFRSEGRVKNWSQYKEGTNAGILSLADAMSIMSTPRHRNRLSPNYVSTLQETVPAFVARLLEVTNSSPFWDLRPS